MTEDLLPLIDDRLWKSTFAVCSCLPGLVAPYHSCFVHSIPPPASADQGRGPRAIILQAQSYFSANTMPTDKGPLTEAVQQVSRKTAIGGLTLLNLTLVELFPHFIYPFTIHSLIVLLYIASSNHESYLLSPNRWKDIGSRSWILDLEIDSF